MKTQRVGEQQRVAVVETSEPEVGHDHGPILRGRQALIRTPMGSAAGTQCADEALRQRNCQMLAVGEGNR